MAQVLLPVWKDLDEVIRSARHQLILCSPFYSHTGLQHVRANLPHGLLITVQIFTRISPSDWANRISDPEALLLFLQTTSMKGHSTTLFVHQRFHAKAYVADKQKALIGSSNLSDGGFEHNIEIMVLLNGKAASDAVSLIDSKIRPEAKNVTIEQLKTWITHHKKSIEEVRKAAESMQAGKLRDAQRTLDEMLGFGKSKAKIPEVTTIDLHLFMEWLTHNRTLAGSEMLIARHENVHGQNLQGHVKQCFFGVLRFIMEDPALQNSIASALKTMRSETVYQLTDEISAAWLKHIDEHATDSGDGYDYAILRGILPPSVGGNQEWRWRWDQYTETDVSARCTLSSGELGNGAKPENKMGRNRANCCGGQ
ncbi:MAG: phospholipase D-like domain-containing protein [Thermoguttaceae bacterium]